MTLTTTQLAGMSDDQLIELASTDFERELAGRLTEALMQVSETTEHFENLEVEGLDEARSALEDLDDVLSDAKRLRLKLANFVRGL